MICSFSREQVERYIKYVYGKITKEGLNEFEALSKSIYNQIPNKENALSYIQMLPDIYISLFVTDQAIKDVVDPAQLAIAGQKSKDWPNSLEEVRKYLGLVQQQVPVAVPKLYADAGKDLSIRAFNRAFQKNNFVQKGVQNWVVNNIKNPDRVVNVVVGKYSASNLKSPFTPITDLKTKKPVGTLQLPVQHKDFYVHLQYEGKNIGFLIPMQYYNNGEPITLDQLSELVEVAPEDLAELKRQEPLYKALFKRLESFTDGLAEGQTVTLTVEELGLHLEPNYNKFDILEQTNKDDKPVTLGTPDLHSGYQNDGKGFIIRSAINGQYLTEAKDPDAPQLPVYKDAEGGTRPFKGYYALVTMPNGRKFWSGVRPTNLSAVKDTKVFVDDVYEAAKRVAGITEQSPENSFMAEAIADELNSKYYFYAGNDYNIFFITSYDPNYVGINGTQGAYILRADILLKDVPPSKTVPSVYFDRRSKVETFEGMAEAFRVVMQEAGITGVEITPSNLRYNIPFNRTTGEFNILSQEAVGNLFTTTLGNNIFFNSFFTLGFKESTTEQVEKQEVAAPKARKVVKASSKRDAIEKIGRIVDHYIDDEEANPFRLLSHGGQPITKEELADLKKTLPSYISIDDLDTIARNLNVKGIPVGYFRNNVLYISSTRATEGTAYHESFHAIFRTALNNSEISTYLSEGRAKLLKQKPDALSDANVESFASDRGYRNMSRQELEDLIVEEFLADEYASYRLKDSKPKGILSKLFQKLLNLFRWLTSRNTDLESLYNKIKSGGFRGSEIKPNRFSTLGDGVFALLPGRATVQESERVVKTVAGLKTENPSKSVYDILDDLADFYDPDSVENSAAIEAGTLDREALLSEWGFYSHDTMRALIKQEVDKVLANYNYNEEQEEFEEIEQEEGRGAENKWDSTPDEIGGWDSVSREIRSFILFTTYPVRDSITGKMTRQIIDGEYVYANIERAVAGKRPEEILASIKALGRFNPQIQAVYDKLKDKTGLVESTRDTTGNESTFFDLDPANYKENLAGKQLMIRFLKAFEKTFVNHLQVLVNTSELDSGGDIIPNTRVFSSNRDDVGNILFTRWQSNYLSFVSDKIANSLVFRNDTVAAINAFLQAYTSGNPITDDHITKLSHTLSSLAMEFHPTYLKFSFSDDTDTAVTDLRTQFADVPRLDQAFLIRVRDYVARKQNLFEAGDVTTELLPDTETGELHQRDIGLTNFISKFSAANAVFDSNIFQTNFQTADNKTRYSFILPNFMVARTLEVSRELMTTEGIQKALNDPYLRYNHLINFASGETNIDFVRDNFKNLAVEFTGDIREEETVGEFEDTKYTKQRLGNTFKNTDDKALLLTVHSLFANQFTKTAQIGGRLFKRTFARFWPFQIEAKSSMMSVTLPVMDGLYNKGISSYAQTVLLNYFKQEVKKIQESLKPKADRTIDFDMKNRNFAYFKFMNNPRVDSLLGIKRVNGVISEIDPKFDAKVTEAIKAELVRGLNAEIAAHKELLQQHNIIEGNINTLLPVSAITKYGGVDNYIGQFFLNDFINTIGYNQMVLGDLAQFKDDVDFTKRMGGIFASGNSRGNRIYTTAYTTEAIRYVYKDSFENGTPDTTEVTKTDEETDGEFNARIKQGLKDGSIIEINTDDGGAEMTAQEFINILYDLGRLTPNKLEALELLRDGIIPGSPQEERYKQLALEIAKADGKDVTLAIDGVALKLVSFGGERNNIYYDKMSVSILFKNFTSRYDRRTGEWVAQKGLEALHNKRVWMEKNGIGQSVPKSAAKIKVGKQFDEATFRDVHLDANSDLPENFIYEPQQRQGKFQRLQVEVSSHGLDTVTNFSQAIQLIDTELSDAYNQDRIDYYKTLKALRDNSMKQALDMVTKEYEVEGERVRDIKTFLKKLRENVESSNPNYSLMEFLEAEGVDSKYDFNLPGIITKVEQLFLAHFNSGVLSQRLRGRSFILRSPRDYKVIVGDNDTVVTREAYLKSPEQYENNDTRELRVHKLVNKDGTSSIQHAEIAISRGTAKLLGLRIGSTVPPELLEGFGVRIPTQSHHSMIPFKVVDFLPDYMGDTIIIPKEVIWLSGADFDIDKLFAYFRDFYMDKGRPVLYGTAKTPGQRYKEYIKWQLENNKTLKGLIKEKQNNPELDNLLSRRKILERQFFTGKLQDTVSDLIDSLFDPTLKGQERKEEITRSLDSIIEEYNHKDVKAQKDAIYEELVSVEHQIQELKDKIVTESYRELNLYTPQDFEKDSTLTNNGALHNKLVDAHLKFVRSTEPTIVESLRTPATMDGLKDDADLLNSITGQAEGQYLVSGMNGKMSAWKNNVQGKKLVGVWANSNSVGANLTKFKVDLSVGVIPTFDNVHYGTFAKEVEDDIVIDTESRSVSIVPNARRKADSISSGVSASTDNAKERLLARLNYDLNNTGVYSLMIALGIGRLRTNLFAAQPILREVSRLKQKEDTSIRPDNKDGFKEVLKSVSNILTDSLGYDTLEAIGDNPSIDSQELLDRLYNERGGDPITNALIDYKVLKMFERLQKTQMAMRKYAVLVSINRGISSSFDYIEKIRDAAYSLDLGDLVGLERLPIHKAAKLPFNIRSRVVTAEGNDVVDYNIYGNLLAIKEILEVSPKFFIGQTAVFKEGVKELSSSLEVDPETEEVDPTTVREIKKNFFTFLTMKAYRQWLKDVRGIDAAKYNGLVYTNLNEKTLATQFRDLLTKKEFRDNELVKFIKTDLNKRGLDLVRVNSRLKSTAKTEQRFVDAYDALIRSEDKEIKMFGYNMFAYLMIKDGFNFVNGSFVKFIKPSMFINFAGTLKKLSRAMSSNNDALAKEVLGNSLRETVNEFKDVWGRNVQNRDELRILPTDKDDNGKVILKKKVGPYSFGRDGDAVTLTTVPISTVGSLKSSDFIPYSVRENGTVKLYFPDFFQYGRILLKREITKEAKGKDGTVYTAVYRTTTMYGAPWYNPYTNSLEYSINNYGVSQANVQNTTENSLQSQEKVVSLNKGVTFEQDMSTGYAARTGKNASADATIALATDFTSAGEKLTKKLVKEQGKEYIPIDANKLEVTPARVSAIVNALNKVSAKTLNIAGNGIYTMKGKYTQKQVDDFTYDLLKAVLESPALKNKITSIRTGGQTGFDEAGAKAGMRLGIPTLVLAPRGWKFRNINGVDVSNEAAFKARFEGVVSEVRQANTAFERVNSTITRSILKANPKTLYLFGDNEARKGLGGQAKEMRGEPNAVGIATKHAPTMNEKDFFSDATYDKNITTIKADIDRAIAEWNTGKYTKVVVPPMGEGLAQLPTRAPRTFAFLQQELARLEEATRQPQEVARPAAVVNKNRDLLQEAIERAELKALEGYLTSGEEYMYYLKGLPKDGKALSAQEREELLGDDSNWQEIENYNDFVTAKEVEQNYPWAVFISPKKTITTSKILKDAVNWATEIYTAGKDEFSGGDFNSLIQRYKQGRMSEETKQIVEDILTEYGLIDLLDYNPAQLSLFSDEDIQNEINNCLG